MRRRRRKKRSARAERIADVLRLCGLALDVNGTAWIRVGVDRLRARTRGALGVACLVVGIALRLLPFLLGAGPIVDPGAPALVVTAPPPASAPAAPGWTESEPPVPHGRGHRIPVDLRVAREALPVESPDPTGREDAPNRIG